MTAISGARPMVSGTKMKWIDGGIELLPRNDDIHLSSPRYYGRLIGYDEV